MGKKNKKGFNSLKELDAQRQSLEKKMKQISIDCSHTKHNGKFAGKFIEGTNILRCDRCGAKFNPSQYSHKTLKDAVQVCNDAINQIKMFSENPDDGDDGEIISMLGSIAYNLSDIPELYRRTVSEDGGGKKKKKKHNNNYDGDGFGHYGDLGSFTGKSKKGRW